MNDEDYNSAEEIYNKLTALLKLFKNRPYHLAKYLLDNSAFSDDFLNNLLKSSKISDLSKSDKEINENFTSISQMEDFYKSLINDIEGKSKREVKINLNKKLNKLIDSENFEEAAKLRDYMIRNNIKRI